MQNQEWMAKEEEKDLRYMAHRRILWVKATTLDVDSVHIVHLHQATSGDVKVFQQRHT